MVFLSVKLLNYLEQLIDLHGTQVGNVVALDLTGQRFLTEPRAVTQLTWPHSNELSNAFLRALRHGLNIVFDIVTYKSVDHTFKVKVKTVTQIGLDQLGVVQVVEFFWAKIFEFFVVVEQTGTLHGFKPWAVILVDGQSQRAFVDRLVHVKSCIHIDTQLLPDTVTVRTHARGIVK